MMIHVYSWLKDIDECTEPGETITVTGKNGLCENIVENYHDEGTEWCEGYMDGGHIFEPRTQADVDWITNLVVNVKYVDTYLGIKWINNKWRYITDEALVPNAFLSNFKPGKDVGSGSKICVTFRKKGVWEVTLIQLTQILIRGRAPRPSLMSVNS